MAERMTPKSNMAFDGTVDYVCRKCGAELEFDHIDDLIVGSGTGIAEAVCGCGMVYEVSAVKTMITFDTGDGRSGGERERCPDCTCEDIAGDDSADDSDDDDFLDDDENDCDCPYCTSSDCEGDCDDEEEEEDCDTEDEEACGSEDDDDDDEDDEE